ncbi:MAG: hypothetical protein WAM24_16855 [Ignavibacteriaceae bacterium]
MFEKQNDIWILAEKTNAEKILKTLDEFGFPGIGTKEKDLMTPELIIQLGCTPNRIDLITYVSGLNFNECYEKRVEVNIDEIKINFIDLENLKKNKRPTGRRPRRFRKFGVNI